MDMVTKQLQKWMYTSKQSFVCVVKVVSLSRRTFCHLFIVSFSFSIHVRLSAEEQMRLGYVCETIHNSSE